MTKQEFLSSLRGELAGLPQEDVKRTVEYYEEMIDDRIESGMAEEESIAELGSVEEIRAQILSEIPLAKLMKERLKPKRALRVWEISLLIIGSPLWFSLLLTAVLLTATVYLLVWTLVVVAYAVDVACVLYGVAGTLWGLVVSFGGNFYSGLFFFSSALILGGLSIFFFFGCNYLLKGIWYWNKGSWLWIKKRLIKKEEKQ